MAKTSGYYSKFYSSFCTTRQRSVWRDSGGVLLGFNILKLYENPDSINQEVKTAKIMNWKEKTGTDRLRLMFSYDEFGKMSPEMGMVVNGAMLGAFTGTLIGGTLHSKESFIKFIERNQGTAFQSTFEAQKQLQTKVTLGFARGAWILGWRLGVFCGSFMLFTTSISVYRGKSSIIEYLVGGGATGILFKLKQGPRAMVAGGIFGGALGALAGSVNLAIMYLTGVTMEEIRYWQYEWKEELQADKQETLRKARAADLDILTKAHEERTASTTPLLEVVEDQSASNSIKS
ncbi:RPII140-upstream gene protein-like [Homarus americanus]|uniref:Complex I assembly factor TIMMDC1, mitochondrial n=1 Tax=Homarus americanus TaxID=6706 RepID=A0A8J5N7L2_HOMAM|nr:RPII140-upstream gene protein-like [Homarus americanus]KAG7174544.1 RPII140-upstream protein-like [Homarus americanus]